MLKLSKKVEYALISLLHIADKEHSDLISARELSDIYHIPPELLGKVLQSLTKAGLIGSIQGVKGGYYLTQSLEKVSIDQVINVVEGPIKIVKCVEKRHSNCECQQIDFCTIRNPMDILQRKINNFFKNISLQNIKTEMKNTTSIKDIYLK